MATKPCPPSGGGTVTASSPMTPSSGMMSKKMASPNGDGGEGGSNANAAATRRFKIKKENPADDDDDADAGILKTTVAIKMESSAMAGGSPVPLQEERYATSLTPSLEESKISEDNLESSLEVSIAGNSVDHNDDDVVMNDAAPVKEEQKHQENGDEDNAVKVKIETTEGECVDIAMEVETPEKMNEWGGASSSDPPVASDAAAAGGVTAEKPHPPPSEKAGELQKDEIIVGGIAADNINSDGNHNHKDKRKSESDMADVANKLTGVSTTAAPAAAIAAGSDDDGALKNQTSSGTPSFSMTLAIGPEDTQRVFCASRAFNAEIQKLQRSDAEASKNRGEGAEVTAKREDLAKRKSMEPGDDGGAAAKKIMPAIVHSPPSREENPLLPPDPNAATSADDPLAYRVPRPPSNPPPPATNPIPPTSPPSHPSGPRPLRELLVPAARNANDPLIAAFLNKMDFQKKTREEQQTSLLFFLDADKSTKLLAAFDVLSNSLGGDDDGGARKEETSDADSASKLVKRAGLIGLFRSFLTSISTCVHGEERGSDGRGGAEGGRGEGGASNVGKSGSSASTPTVQNTDDVNRGNDVACGDDGNVDWKGSDKTLKEILEVATFAADNLIAFAEKEAGIPGNPDEEGGGSAGASFDVFGRWYNSGGFSLVPWLELLDLSKWDYADDKDCDDGQNADPDSDSNGQHPSSSSKRARIQGGNEPLTPGVATMNEPIGSPTTLFASGSLVGATPQPPRKRGGAMGAGAFEQGGSGIVGGMGMGGGAGGGVRSFSAMFGEMDESRTVVSFDFSGSSPTAGPGNAQKEKEQSSFHIDITEENLVMLRKLVRRTGFSDLRPAHVESLMMKHARVERHKHGEMTYVISRAQFGKFIREVVPRESSKRFDPAEIENFSNYFTNFFTCFDYSWSELKKDEVNAKELMVGFSFLFAGNKSSKLAAAYEMLDTEKNGYLTQRGLMQYLRSYLTMLAGISLLSANKRTTTQIRKRLLSPNQRDDAFMAVENGAKWTLSHFLRAFEKEHSRQPRNSTRSNAVTFEDFAKWYTEGGYAVAPWLELLDLQKFLSLIGEEAGKRSLDEERSLAEVLFTFPLAKDRSLVVLRDDAHYVRSVVNELGLLSLTSEDIWSVLFNDVAKGMQLAAGGGSMKPKKSVRMEVDQTTFVQCMLRILSGTGKMKHRSSEWTDFSPEDTLKNFFLSFDLAQKERVALNQLMCGLTLLCGGKKSNKLVFAFGLFGGEDSGKNGKRKASMAHSDFFCFFRSFLIVMFSCCNQSLNLSADAVTQYISDTAKEVADDVMAYWKAKKVEKVKFENFSEWYNEGGFETAPWLELLDLNKWVLADRDTMGQQGQQQQTQLQQQQTQQPPQQQTQQAPQQPQQPQHQQLQHQPVPVAPMTPAPTKPPAASSHTPGLTPGHEAIKALLASPKVKANGLSPDCPPAPPDDDPLFDLNMSDVDAEVDEMDLFLLSFFPRKS